MDDKLKKVKLKVFCDIFNEKFGVLIELNVRILDQLDEDDFEKEIDEISELKMMIQERIINIELVIKVDSSESEDDDDIVFVWLFLRVFLLKKIKWLI